MLGFELHPTTTMSDEHAAGGGDIKNLKELPLVRFNMDLSQLKDYLDNIIKVVNQHAKLLHTLNREMMVRTTEKQMADLFILISAGLPYESLVKKIGGVPPPRRGSVVKLLGDSSLLPNNNQGV